MPDKKIFQLKAELTKMTKGNLLGMALSKNDLKMMGNRLMAGLRLKIPPVGLQSILLAFRFRN